MKLNFPFAFLMLSALVLGVCLPAGAAEPASDRALVVYFSWGGTTKKVAEEIARQTGADLFEITTTKPYPKGYNECLDAAKKEQAAGARPELASHVQDMGQYGVVFLGWPCWWGTMPMPCFTFLDEYDLSGKTVIPFSTHGGSGWARGPEDLKAAEPGANILEGLCLTSGAAANPADAVKGWLGKLELAK